MIHSSTRIMNEKNLDWGKTMSIWNDPRLRKLFREKREHMGLKQQDLADHIVSAATISNYETGKKRVGVTKIIYIFQKVGITETDLPQLLHVQEQDETDFSTILDLQLKAIESGIDCGDVMRSLKRLREVSVGQEHPKACIVEYLRGKCYFKREKWEKALSYFELAIDLSNKNQESRTSNIIAASLYHIGRIYCRENNMNHALSSVNEGLQSIQPEKERADVYYRLLLSKAIYLEKLERNEESLQTLEFLQRTENQIDTKLTLNLYELLATLSKKMGMYTKAIVYTEKGIEIAKQSKNYDRLFELWTTLGSIYKNMEHYDLAKICFQTSAELEDRIARKILSVYNQTQLGTLYIRERNYESAEQVLLNAVQIGERVNGGIRLCEALVALADCYHKQQKDHLYIQYLEKAYNISDHYQFHVQKKSILLKFTQHYENIDTNKYQEYLTEYYKESVKLGESM